MPIFRLTEELIFPPVELGEPDGLLAVGGDLGAERLLLAYRSGIFPWYSGDSPVLWWSPDPRLVLYPGELKLSRSLRQTIKRKTFNVTFDTAFTEVINKCAEVRRTTDGGTWITPLMQEAYTGLHRLGHAHSAEAWLDGELAGGLYGLAIGAAFFGESMFSQAPDASKAAFAALVAELEGRGCEIIDCQMPTEHLKNFGAREIPRAEFIVQLTAALKGEINSQGLWDTGTCLAPEMEQ